MKKYIDKLSKKIHINKNLFIFLLVIVIVGIISGSIFGLIIDENDKSLVYNYLQNFFSNIKLNKINYNTTILNNIFFTVGIALLIWLLGISIIGFFIILFILFIKAFIIGFSFTSIIVNFKLKGVLLAIIYIFPHQIINILVFMLLSSFGLIISFKLIRCVLNKKDLNLKNIMNRYIIVLLVSSVILLLTSFYEVYIVPKLISIALKLHF